MSGRLDALNLSLAGRYRVEREIGHGGMANVYLATDLKHDRRVALKVLRPELSSTMGADRFPREIHIIAQLQHPHILSLYDSGEVDGIHYFVMPFVDGQTLRDRLASGPLSIAETVRILTNIAEALAYAHKAGVIHRDLKPENVLLSGKHATLSDFGIAKAIERSATDKVTTVGIAVGTPLYMAPEQATAEASTDHRADIYAVGVLGYEMLTGRPVFDGANAQAILSAHVLEPPRDVRETRPDAPAPLAEAILKCLAKQPQDRWQSADDLLVSLERVVVTPGEGVTPTDTRPVGGFDEPAPVARMRRRWALAGAVLVLGAVGGLVALRADRRNTAARTLAVLPFDNIGGDTADVYFAEGMADELIATLGHVPGLRVAGRNSSFSDRLRRAAPEAIARELNVGAYVTGSIQRSGGRVRVVAQLISTADGVALWGATFERPFTDVIDLQDDISRAIAGELRVQLAAHGAQASESHGTTDPESYRMYLQGKQLWAKRGKENLRASIQLFQSALARDSSFVRAHSGLALAYVVLPGYDGLLDQDSTIALAVAHATRALASVPNDPDAHLALGFADAFGWKWKDAEQEFDRVLQWDPSSTTAHLWFGMTLMAENRADPAIEQLRTAVDLDPLSQVAGWNLGIAYLIAGRFDDAYAISMQTLKVDTLSARATSNAAITAMFAGRNDEYMRLSDRSYLLSGLSDGAMVDSAFYLKNRGDLAGAREQLRRAQRGHFVPLNGPFGLVPFYVAVGERDSAFAMLNRFAGQHYHGFVDNYQICHPYFADLWTDPRFAAIVQRMGVTMCGVGGSRPRR